MICFLVSQARVHLQIDITQLLSSFEALVTLSLLNTSPLLFSYLLILFCNGFNVSYICVYLEFDVQL